MNNTLRTVQYRNYQAGWLRLRILQQQTLSSSSVQVEFQSNPIQSLTSSCRPSSLEVNPFFFAPNPPPPFLPFLSLLHSHTVFGSLASSSRFRFGSGLSIRFLAPAFHGGPTRLCLISLVLRFPSQFPRFYGSDCARYPAPPCASRLRPRARLGLL